VDTALRFAICSSLVVFGILIMGGALALLPHAVETAVIARAERAEQLERAKSPCQSQDRDCLSPTTQARKPEVVTETTTVPVEVTSATGSVAQHVAGEIQDASPERREPSQQIELKEPVRDRDTTELRPTTEERQVEGSNVKRQTRTTVVKRSNGRARDAKVPTNEALRAVRRFGDDLHDIPVSAYAADGTKRSIVIRPTSIQDVYYYSVPR
jgi:hypothetical protein